MTRGHGTRLDHYELIEHLADGAQAEVHRATDLESGREVVIKFPHPSVLSNPVLAARWRRELVLTEGLVHPNVERRLDHGERHREPYAVVEYVRGGTVDRWFEADGPLLPVEQAIEWGRQVAQALAYLHDEGIIHRDVKPSNVLVTDDLTMKLTDFGAAARTPKAPRWWDLPTPPEGTPEYLSPEQVIGSPGSERSDIYQWGVLVYELLTGRVPFTGADPLAAMEAHLREDPRPIRELRPSVPPIVEAVVLTALHRRPERRQQSAAALLDELMNLGELDVGRFDLERDRPVTGAVGGSELQALFRLIVVVVSASVGVVVLAMSLTLLLQ